MEFDPRPTNLQSGSIEELNWATKQASSLRQYFMSEYMKDPQWVASSEFNTYFQEVNGIISKYYEGKIIHHKDVNMLELQAIAKSMR